MQKVLWRRVEQPSALLLIPQYRGLYCIARQKFLSSIYPEAEFILRILRLEISLWVS
jgi:hypothetical protein